MTWPAPDPTQRVPMDPPAEHTTRAWLRMRAAYTDAMNRKQVQR